MKSPALTGVVSALAPVSACTTAPLKMPGCAAARLTVEEACRPGRRRHRDDVRAQRRFRRYVEVDLGVAGIERMHVDTVERNDARRPDWRRKASPANPGSHARDKRSCIHHGANHRHRAARVQSQRDGGRCLHRQFELADAPCTGRPLETGETRRIGSGDRGASRCRLWLPLQCAPRGTAVR